MQPRYRRIPTLYELRKERAIECWKRLVDIKEVLWHTAPAAWIRKFFYKKWGVEIKYFFNLL